MSSSTTASDATKYYALTYKYVPDILEKRGAHRAAHLQLLQQYGKQCLLGGAMNPPKSALIIFKSPKSTVEEFVKADPYVSNKLVTEYDIQEWSCVTGSLYDGERPTK